MTFIHYLPFAFLIALTGCQSVGRRLVLPGSYLKGSASTLAASSEYRLAELTTAGGEKVATQFGEALDIDGKPAMDWRERVTVLFSYGNRMSMAASQPMFWDLRRGGVNVMLFDYPGYGMSPGRPSEASCYASAMTAYRHLIESEHVAREKIVATGLSVGSGVALDLASKQEVAGVILIVPFTSTRDVGTDVGPWYLRWAVPALAGGGRFDNLSTIVGLRAPLLVVSATRDQLTSVERTQQLLRAATHAQVTHLRVDADHDGAWEPARSEVIQWLSESRQAGTIDRNRH
jgi:alpha-beta hydrolase superfamily lysophospholipase